MAELCLDTQGSQCLSCILFSHKIAKEVSLYFCEKEPTLECIRPIEQHIIFYSWNCKDDNGKRSYVMSCEGPDFCALNIWEP